MDVALHGDGNFGTSEGLHDGLSSWRLRFVPFAIVLGDGMDIVCGLIGIDDRKRLAGLQGQDVGMILAALLVDGYRRRHRRKRVLAEVAL